MNGNFTAGTIKVFETRERYARTELRNDKPLLILPLRHSVVLASLTNPEVSPRFITLVNHPCSLVILGGRGSFSDLALIQDELREQVAQFSKAVSDQDISGKLVTDTVSEILREHFLEKLKSPQIFHHQINMPNDIKTLLVWIAMEAPTGKPVTSI